MDGRSKDSSSADVCGLARLGQKDNVMSSRTHRSGNVPGVAGASAAERNVGVVNVLPTDLHGDMYSVSGNGHVGGVTGGAGGQSIAEGGFVAVNHNFKH